MNKANRDSSFLDRNRMIPKTLDFDILVKEVGDINMAEYIWAYWGNNSLSMLNFAMPALNQNRKWWQFLKPKNTIKSLIQSEEGRDEVWQMLNDAGAWM